MTAVSERYTVTVSCGVNVRSEPSVGGRIVGSACYGRDCIMRQFNDSRTWGYTDMIICTNGSQAGWVCLENLTNGWPCKIDASPCLRLRREPGSTDQSNTVLTTIPKNEIVICSETRKFGSSVWMRTSFHGQTGWICFCNESEQYAHGVSDVGTCF